jgi:hypothetical protein
MTTFELWEMHSGNLMAIFATRQDALRVAPDAAIRLADAYVDSLSLTSVKKSGGVRELAEGRESLLLAQGAETSSSPASA